MKSPFITFSDIDGWAWAGPDHVIQSRHGERRISNLTSREAVVLMKFKTSVGMHTGPSDLGRNNPLDANLFLKLISSGSLENICDCEGKLTNKGRTMAAVRSASTPS